MFKQYVCMSSRACKLWKLKNWSNSEWQVQIKFYYRATLCVRAVFAPARCLSVRLSVTLVHCIQTAEDILKLLCRPGSPIILVFWSPSAGTQLQGNPFSGDAKYQGWENFAIFDWNPRLSRKWYEIGPLLLWNVGMKSYGEMAAEKPAFGPCMGLTVND